MFDGIELIQQFLFHVEVEISVRNLIKIQSDVIFKSRIKKSGHNNYK